MEIRTDIYSNIEGIKSSGVVLAFNNAHIRKHKIIQLMITYSNHLHQINQVFLRAPQWAQCSMSGFRFGA